MAMPSGQVVCREFLDFVRSAVASGFQLPPFSVKRCASRVIFIS